MGVHSRASESQLRLRDVLIEVQDQLERIIETCDRTDGLIAAILLETSEFEQDEILGTIVHAVVELVGVRYGALKVCGHGYQLNGFIYEDVYEVARVKTYPRPHSDG